MQKIISIAFSCSDEYAQHLSVAMTSILQNNERLNFIFYILNKNISDRNRDIISSICNSYSNCRIEFISVDEERFKSITVSGSYLSLETYFRFLLAEVLPEVDKVLFLDSDLIVNGNIEPLFDTDVEDYYFAGVEERCLYGTGYIEDVLKFTSDELYVNAGVLLCNLRKIREDGLVQKFFNASEALKGFIKYDDQDVINIVAKKRIKQLDCIYNFTPYHLYELYKKKYSAVIIHYTGKYKPWTLGECPNELRFLYFKYLAKSPYNRFLRVKNFCIYHKSAYLWETDLITPIQTGSYFTKRGMDMLQSSSGDSIDFKNKNYGELTAWYWVWKNFIPNNPYVEYIGFCHYRRFLDYRLAPIDGIPVLMILPEVFLNTHNYEYSSQSVYQIIKEYDLIIPSKVIFKETIEHQYLQYHPKKDLDILKDLIKSDYPEYYPFLEKLLSANAAYFNLVFTMKVDMLNEFLGWTFDILGKLEKSCDWSSYKEYYDVRTPAFLVERLFNVWVEYHREKYGIKVLEREMYLLDCETISSDNIKQIADHLLKNRIKKAILKIKVFLFWGKRRDRYVQKYKNIKMLITAAEELKRLKGTAK